MRKVVFALMVILLISGCQENVTPVFIMTHTLEVPFFPETNTAKTLVVRDNAVRSQYEKMLNEHGLTTEDIKEVRVREAVLVPLDHGYNYGLLSRIEVNIFEVNDPNDLLPIAEIVPRLNEKQGELQLFPGLPNIKSYVEQDVFGLDIGYSYRQPFADRVNNQLVLRLEAIQ